MFNPFEARLAPPPQFLLLIWLCLTGLVLFGAAVIVDQGLLQEMLAADRSQICLVVIAMYCLGLGHTFVRTLALARELALAETQTASLACTAPQAGAVSITAEAVQPVDAAPLTPGFFSNYLREHYSSVLRETREGEGGDLLEAYASRLRATTEFGWFFIDLMLKVGFLGTLVGFILMLSSVANSGTLDATTMQKVLTQMSVGMSTALYTTLASLVGGILLSVPYYLHDRGLERLLQLTVHARDVLLPARLAVRG